MDEDLRSSQQHEPIDLSKQSVEEVGRADLAGDIFSSPVMIAGCIFVGCRDDHVHCIQAIHCGEPSSSLVLKYCPSD